MNPERSPYLFLVFVSGVLLLPFFSVAQSLQLLHRVPVNKPGVVSLDRLNNIYFSDQKNNIHQVSPDGKQVRTYSPATQAHVALVEAWNLMRILIFYDDRQQVTLLDRFLTPLSSYRLADVTDGNIRLATLASNEQIWLLNESDFTLNKVDVHHPEALTRTQLNLHLNNTPTDFCFMREYQNNLYIIDRQEGIYIFDNLGTYKKKLPLKGLTYLGFTGEEAYYLKKDQLIFFNLYTLKERSVTIPAHFNYFQVLASQNTICLFSETSLDIYRLTP